MPTSEDIGNLFKDRVLGLKRTSPSEDRRLVNAYEAMPITPQEWEHMIETALSSADQVVESRNMQGELYRYHVRRWRYWPYIFDAGWEVTGGTLVILTFDASNLVTGKMHVLRDTAAFRGILIEAEQTRKALL